MYSTLRDRRSIRGLLCLCDADGPCANAVKDAQRTKTSAGTQMTLSILWGYRGAVERTRRAAAWYRQLLTQAGAKTDDVTWAGALWWIDRSSRADLPMTLFTIASLSAWGLTVLNARLSRGPQFAVFAAVIVGL